MTKAFKLLTTTRRASRMESRLYKQQTKLIKLRKAIDLTMTSHRQILLDVQSQVDALRAGGNHKEAPNASDNMGNISFNNAPMPGSAVSGYQA